MTAGTVTLAQWLETGGVHMTVRTIDPGGYTIACKELRRHLSEDGGKSVMTIGNSLPEITADLRDRAVQWWRACADLYPPLSSVVIVLLDAPCDRQPPHQHQPDDRGVVGFVDVLAGTAYVNGVVLRLDSGRETTR